MLKNQKINRILFVCLGNICRSPTAEGVFRHHLKQTDWAKVVEHDSCGTHDYHIGSPPDDRAIAHAKKRGIVIGDLRARQIDGRDFEYYDLILAADRRNLAMLKEDCPPSLHHKLALMLDYSTRYQGSEVPDPYYGGAEGFERVLDMLEDMAEGLLKHLDNQRR